MESVNISLKEEKRIICRNSRSER